MPEIIETTVYQLHELSDVAKEKARAWFREGGFDHDWYDAVYADFEQICAILGVVLKTNTVRLMDGRSRQESISAASGARGTARVSKGAMRMRLGCLRRSASMRRMTPRFIRSLTPCRPYNGAISANCEPMSAIGVTIITRIAWRSTSSARARPDRT